jgi:hypothetical protein
VADELNLPVDYISIEMIYRGLSHFSVARQNGLADDPIKYFAAPENQDLGIVKSIRKPLVRLIIAPFPIHLLREIQRCGVQQVAMPRHLTLPDPRYDR